MGAICKTILIHGDNLQPLLDYGEDKEKTSLEANDLENLLSYASNSEKTTILLPEDGERSVLVSGVGCNPNTAQEEFAKVRNRYRENNPEYLPSFEFLDKKTKKSRNVQKKPVTAIHLIQSFEEKDIDPQVAHQIGIELCERLGVQAVVDTHVNKDHVHNHIIINAYMPDEITKFSMNNEKRIEIRRLSDDIQREYGLAINFLDPEQQQKIAKRSVNYREWLNEREGKSWKDRMRGDIAAIRGMVDDKDEFIEVMQDYGYHIEKQKGKDSIMWLNVDEEKMIWDSTLGEEYMLCNLFPDEKPEHERIVETEQSRKSNYHQTIPVISVKKYDYSGQRRSGLELLIRGAIARLQKVYNFIVRYMNNKNQKHNVKAKLDMMQEALSTLKEFGIENTDDLNEKINLAGKNLSVAKSAVSRVNGEMQYYSTIERVITEYRDAKTLYDSVKVWAKPHDLHINKFSERDISLGIAQIAPLSGIQKSELYQMMQKRPNLRLVDSGKGYCNISAIEFRQIKDYFKGKGERPACLADISDTTASSAYERQYNIYKPTDVQKEKAKQLLTEHGFDNIDTDTLTLADIINIDNCWGECPFHSPLITEEKQQLLQAKLQEADKTVNRGVSQIMENEYEEIMDFLDGKSKKLPQLLKNDTLPTDTDLENVKKLSEELGVTSSVDINHMTNTDVRNFYNWLISQGKDPMCTKISEDVDETMSAYEKQYQVLSPRLSYKPTNAQKKKAKQLLKKHGFDYVDIDKLIMADIIQINNCWGECPFASPLISKEQQQTLQEKLQEADKSINRDVSQIMESEYSQIMNFLDGRTKKIPQVMKKILAPSETDLKKTQKLAVTLGIKPTVNINHMNSDDIRNLYNWMISQGKAPMCTNLANAATWQQNKDIFHEEIKCETPRKQEVLIRLRNAENALSQLGIIPEDIPEILTRITEVKTEQQELKETQTDFADQYKQLLRLKQQLSYTKDKTFFYGTLLDESEIKSIEEDLKKEEQELEETLDEKPEEEKKELSEKALAAAAKFTKKHHILDNDLDL